MQQTPAPSSPRAYADQMLACHTDAEREQVYRRCPTEWHGMVNRHVELARQKNAKFTAKREALRLQTKAEVPSIGKYVPPMAKRGSAVVAAQHLANARASIGGTAPCR